MTPNEAFTSTTAHIRVIVRTFYLPEQSRPEERHFVWAYRVTIENTGEATVQLLRRTWLITDGAGRTQRVHGDGVIGEQPVLTPGKSFEYTSGTPLPTPSGFMRGLYHMVDQADGAEFDVTIPTFNLDSPHEHRSLH